MANPQKENGSTDIANELLEVIYSSGFHATQLEIILCILRYTYGFHRKEHELSINFIAQAIKRHKITVSQEINEMIKSKILIQTSPPSFNSTRKISINKNYEEWILNNALTVSTEHTVSEETTTTVSPETNTTVSPEANQETKNKTKNKTKNIYGEYGRVKLSKDEYERLCKDYGKSFIDNQINLIDEYVESNNNKNKYTNFNLVIRKSIRENWFNKNKQERTIYETI